MEFVPCDGAGQPVMKARISASDSSFDQRGFLNSKLGLWHSRVRSKWPLSQLRITQNYLPSQKCTPKQTYPKRHPAGLLLCSSRCSQATWGQEFAFVSSTTSLQLKICECEPSMFQASSDIFAVTDGCSVCRLSLNQTLMPEMLFGIFQRTTNRKKLSLDWKKGKKREKTEANRNDKKF